MISHHISTSKWTTHRPTSQRLACGRFSRWPLRRPAAWFAGRHANKFGANPSTGLPGKWVKHKLFKYIYRVARKKRPKFLRNYNGAYTLWGDISFGSFVDQYVLLLTYKFKSARKVPSVSRQWFRLHARQHSITPRQSNSNFCSRQHAQFH